MKHDEREHQSAFFMWLRLHESKHPALKRFFAIPNGGLRDRGTAIGLYREGVKRGVLDTFLPYPQGKHHGLWIEFKAGKNKLTDDQCDWFAYLSSAGYSVHVVWEWTEAARITSEYLGLNVLKLMK